MRSKAIRLTIVCLCLGLLSACTHNLGQTMYFEGPGGTFRAECSDNRGSIEAPVYVCHTRSVKHSEVEYYRGY